MQKQPPWKSKFNDILQTCQDELKRTTEIGKKMLSASKTNSNLHESFEELGALVYKKLKDGTLDWSDKRAEEIVDRIDHFKKDLESIESEVNKIKFSSGPVDVSKIKKDKD